MRRLNPDPPDSGSIQATALTVAPESPSWVLLVDLARPTFLRGGGHPVLVELPPGLRPLFRKRVGFKGGTGLGLAISKGQRGQIGFSEELSV